MKAALLIVVASLGLLHAPVALAQSANRSPYVIADVIVIHSKILNEDRKLFIYNPDDVGGNVLPAYPVLYLLEENDMPMVAGMVKYLSSYNEQLPAMLVVGIDSGGQRIRDLTPTHSLYDNLGRLDSSADSWLRSSGGGEKFLQFVREEVMPYIQRHYKTAPFKILAGHSVGGLSAIYTQAAHPDLFNAYIAVSPSLWWGKGSMLPLVKTSLGVPRDTKTFLYLADSPESGPFQTYIKDYLSLLKSKKPAGLTYSHRFYPDETHGSVAAKAYYDGLRFLFPQWNIAETDSSAALIRRHYQQMSERLGYTVEPPFGLVRDWGGSFLRAGKIDDAMEVFRVNVRNFPDSSHAHADLGNTYRTKGDKPNAIASYQKALALNPTDAEIEDKLAELRKQ
jgi:predicted alpha/beta superfamily hydrolase